MTIRHCSWHADLVSYSSQICFLQKPHNFFHFTILSSSVPVSPWILYFFLLSLHWGESCRQCFIVSIWFSHAVFLQVGGGSFLDIKCPWVSLVCPIRILLSWTSYYLQLLYELFHSSMRGLIQCSLLVLFSHFLCHWEFLALLMVRQQFVQGSFFVVIPGISIACFSASSVPLISMCEGTYLIWY